MTGAVPDSPVAVVGGGVVGLCTAHYLAAAGLPVVVVLSGGIMEPRSDAQRIAAANPVTGERPASAPDACDVLYDDYRKLREIAGASGLHFFVARADRRNIPPSVQDTAGRSTNIVAGLEHLASALNAPTTDRPGSSGASMT